MPQKKPVNAAMAMDTSVILTTRPDGLYVWQDGKQIGYYPATSCLNIARQILNNVDI